jgi:dimethylaniline monooxygenase (N-oxide forming)
VEADAVVFATGYVLRLPYLDPAIFEVSMEGLDLYRLVCLPDWPTLAFIGLFRVSGPAPPVAEMQARWAAHILRGDIVLPTPDEQRAAVAERRALVKQHGGNPFRLFAEAYEDILASEIGALPRLWRHPRLWRALLAGPAIAARHRLDGPNSWVGAAQTLLDAQQAQNTERRAQSGKRRAQSAEQA